MAPYRRAVLGNEERPILFTQRYRDCYVGFVMLDTLTSILRRRPISVILVLLILGAAYLLTQPPTEPELLPVPPPVLEGPIEPAWAIYDNLKGGFSIEWRTDWTSEESGSQVRFFSPDQSTTIFVVTFENQELLPLDRWLDEDLYIVNRPIEIQSREPIAMGNLIGIRQDHRAWDGKAKTSVFLTSGTLVYGLTISPRPDNEDIRDTFERMISSFRRLTVSNP